MFLYRSWNSGISLYIQFNSIRFDSIRFDSIRFDSIQFSSVQFSSVQFSSIRFDSIQFNSIQFEFEFEFDSIQFNSIQFEFEFNSIQFNTYICTRQLTKLRVGAHDEHKLHKCNLGSGHQEKKWVLNFILKLLNESSGLRRCHGRAF